MSKRLVWSVIGILALSALLFYYQRGLFLTKRPHSQQSNSELTEPRTTVRRDSSRPDNSLKTYAYASERLEELYQIYPNLRRKPFTKPKSPNFITELNRRFNDLDTSRFHLSREINRDLSRKKWNHQAVADFLNDREGELWQLHAFASYPISPTCHFYRIASPPDEIFSSHKAKRLLRLSLSYEVRSGNMVAAAKTLELIQKFQKALSAQPSLIHGVVGIGYSSSINKTLKKLVIDGYDVTPLIPNRSNHSLFNDLASAYRAEIGTTISWLEAIRLSPNREEILKPLEEREFISAEHIEAFKQVDIFTLEEAFAKSYSQVIDTVETLQTSSHWSSQEEIREQLTPDYTNLPEPEQLILEIFRAHIGDSTLSLAKEERSYRELQTWIALKKAQTDGASLQTIEDLVPHYLPEIPMDPVTAEPFHYDPKKQTIIVPKED